MGSLNIYSEQKTAGKKSAFLDKFQVCGHWQRRLGWMSASSMSAEAAAELRYSQTKLPNAWSSFTGANFGASLLSSHRKSCRV
jgi:hypothetical protein